jgi:hypothetical protein
MAHTPHPGVLVIFTDFAAEEESSIDEWYTREHLRSRVVVPGFRRGRRYAGSTASPRYLAVYDTESSAVLASQASLDVGSNPDAKERDNVPKFRNTIRTICDVTLSLGEGSGGAMALMSLMPPAGEKARLRTRLKETLFPAMLRQRGLIGAQLWETNWNMLKQGSRGFVPDSRQVPDCIIVFEAARETQLRAIQNMLLNDPAFATYDTAVQGRLSVYSLLMSLRQ